MARTLLISAAVVLLAVTLVVLPVEVPYTVSVPGKVYPAKEWVLIRDVDAVGAMLRDHVAGNVESYSINRFERGDAVRLRLRADLEPHTKVSTGDTIGTIYSNETERQLAALSGDLAAATSALKLYAAGEKEPVVREAQKRVERANAAVRQQEKEVERLRRLHERQHAAEQQLELAETQLELLSNDVQIAEAALEAAQTGAKQEQIDLTRTEAEALRSQIAKLQDRLDMYTIRSPIAGAAIRSFGSDTLLTVRDTTAYVVVMPVPFDSYAYVQEDQSVEISMPSSDQAVEGQIHYFGDEVHVLNGEQVLMTTAVVNQPAPSLIPGAMATCTIRTGKISLLEYLRRLIA